MKLAIPLFLTIILIILTYFINNTICRIDAHEHCKNVKRYDILSQWDDCEQLSKDQCNFIDF